MWLAGYSLLLIPPINQTESWQWSVHTSRRERRLPGVAAWPLRTRTPDGTLFGHLIHEVLGNLLDFAAVGVARPNDSAVAVAHEFDGSLHLITEMNAQADY